MIVTVTLNAAVDKTYVLPSFAPGGVYRASERTVLAGGKGINVARVIRALGLDVTATGFVAGDSGAFIVRQCERQGIVPAFVETDGESRTCLTFLDPERGTVTEVLESGPEIPEAAFAALQTRLRELARGAAYVVFSGSLPPGLPPDAYRTLAELVREAGAIPVLDTSGEPLRLGLAARPLLVKPNRREAEALLGYSLDGEAARRKGLEKLRAMGAERVLLSLGEEGAMLADGGTVHRFPALTVEAVNPVGCGDAMLAGVVAGLVRGDSLLEAVRLGIACGSANALSLGAGVVRPEDVKRLLRSLDGGGETV